MSKPASRKPKKTAFVPRGIFASALAAASVIPIIACGGSVTPTLATVAAKAFDGGNKDASNDAHFAADVALQAFDASADRLVATVAIQAFDSGLSDSVAADAFGVADVGFSVADAAFGPDAIHGVAVGGFSG